MKKLFLLLPLLVAVNVIAKPIEDNMIDMTSYEDEILTRENTLTVEVRSPSGSLLGGAEVNIYEISTHTGRPEQSPIYSNMTDDSGQINVKLPMKLYAIEVKYKVNSPSGFPSINRVWYSKATNVSESTVVKLANDKHIIVPIRDYFMSINEQANVAYLLQKGESYDIDVDCYGAPCSTAGGMKVYVGIIPLPDSAVTWTPDGNTGQITITPTETLPPAQLYIADQETGTLTNNNLDTYVSESPSSPSGCEAAVYSTTNQKITFDKLAMELYNLFTDEPNGQFALFTGADMSLNVLSNFKYEYEGEDPTYTGQTITQTNNCYPTYSDREKIVRFPKIKVPSDENTSDEPICYSATLKLSTTQARIFSLTEISEIPCE